MYTICAVMIHLHRVPADEAEGIDCIQRGVDDLRIAIVIGEFAEPLVRVHKRQ